MVDINSIETNTPKDRCLQEQVDHKFYLSFDIRKLNNTMYYDPENYPYINSKQIIFML